MNSFYQTVPVPNRAQLTEHFDIRCGICYNWTTVKLIYNILAVMRVPLLLSAVENVKTLCALHMYMLQSISANCKHTAHVPHAAACSQCERLRRSWHRSLNFAQPTKSNPPTL